MPRVADMIQSKFLRKEDIDEDLVVTITKCTLEDMPGNDNEQRWVLHFRELPKGLVLNTTTIRLLDHNFGSHSDDWVNKRVKIYVDPSVTFGGKVVGGLRLRFPSAKQRAAADSVAPAQQPVKPQVDEEFDDEIPF